VLVRVVASAVNTADVRTRSSTHEDVPAFDHGMGKTPQACVGDGLRRLYSAGGDVGCVLWRRRGSVRVYGRHGLRLPCAVCAGECRWTYIQKAQAASHEEAVW
jgi:hypothetical protein